MNFDDIKNTWNEQPLPSLANDQITVRSLIKSRSEKLQKSEFRLAAVAMAIGILALIFIAGGISLFFIIGTEAIQEAGVFITPSVFVIPLYIIGICAFVMFNYKQQKQMKQTYQKTLRGFAMNTLAHTRNRIQLLRKAPYFLIGLWIVLIIALALIPGLNLFSSLPTPILCITLLGDITVLSAFFWWTRRRIQKHHQPKKTELESIIASIDASTL